MLCQRWVRASGNRPASFREVARRKCNKKGHLRFVQVAEVEAAGIEPASRGESVTASTCVAGLLSMVGSLHHHVRPGVLQPAGWRLDYPDVFLAVAASGATGKPASGDSEPDLATKPGPLRRSSRTRGGPFIRPPERTAVQQLKCDQLFTWPTDQPRHAIDTSYNPVETKSPPC